MNRAAYIEKFGPDYADAFVTPEAQRFGFVRDDGGRRKAGHTHSPLRRGDCAIRAMSIAFDEPYEAVFKELIATDPAWRDWHGAPRRSTATLLSARGWTFTAASPLVRKDCLPNVQRLVVHVPGHLMAVVGGFIRDDRDRTRDGRRHAQGFWTPPGAACTDP